MPQNVPIPKGATIEDEGGVPIPVGAQVGDTPPSKDTFLGESGKQLKSAYEGMKDLNTSIMSGPGTLVKALGNTFSGLMAEAQGRPQEGKSVLTAPTTPLERVSGVVDFALGGDPAAARAHHLQGQDSAAWGDLIAVPAATFGLGEMLRAVLPGVSDVAGRSKSLARATGTTGAADIPEALKTALPELDKTAKLTGTPKDVAGLDKLISDTFRRTESEFNQKLQPISNQQVMPTQISQAIRAKMVPNPKTAIDRAWNAELLSRATEFQQPFTYGELNVQRMNAGDRLDPFYNKTPSAQGAAEGTRASLTVDKIIQDESRDMIYNELQRANPQAPPNYFSDLKKTQSALYDVRDQMKKRRIQLSNDASKSFTDRLRAHSYVSSGGHVGGAVGGITDALFPESAEANKAVAKGMQGPKSGAQRTGVAAALASRRSQPSLAPPAEDDEDGR